MREMPPTPAQVEPYVRVLGVDDAVKFLLVFGGAPLDIAAAPTARSRLVEVIGAEKAQALAAAATDPRWQRRVPLAKPWIAHVLFARGLPKFEIARRLHTTDITVRKYLATPLGVRRYDPRQLPLF